MDPAKMKVVDLRTELLKRGEDTSGLKDVLVNRLRESIAASTAPASTSPSASTTSGGSSSAMEIDDEGGGEGDGGVKGGEGERGGGGMDVEGSELALPRVDAATTFSMNDATATLSPAADEGTWAVLRVAKFGVETEYEIQALATGACSILLLLQLLPYRVVVSPCHPSPPNIATTSRCFLMDFPSYFFMQGGSRRRGSGS